MSAFDDSKSQFTDDQLREVFERSRRRIDRRNQQQPGTALPSAPDTPSVDGSSPAGFQRPGGFGETFSEFLDYYRPGMETVSDFLTGARQSITNQMPGAAASVMGQTLEMFPESVQDMYLTQPMGLAGTYLRGLGGQPGVTPGSALLDIGGDVQSGLFSLDENNNPVILQGEALDAMFYDPNGTAREAGAVAGQVVTQVGLGLVPGGQGLAISLAATSAAGSVVDGYYQYTKEKGIEYDPKMGAFVAAVGGVSEFILNKVPKAVRSRLALNTGISGLEDTVRRTVQKAYIEALRTGDARVGAKILLAALPGTMKEGVEEGITEAIQTAVAVFYRGAGGVDGVTMDQIVEAAMKGALYGGPAGGVITTGAAGIRSGVAGRQGRSDRIALSAETTTRADELRIKARLVEAGLSEGDADKAIEGVERARVAGGTARRRRGAREAAGAAETAPEATDGAEALEDPAGVLRAALGDTRDSDLTEEQAIQQATDAGLLPTPAQKEFVLSGQEDADPEIDGPRPDLRVDKEGVRDLALRLVEKFPQLAQAIRDKGRLTNRDLALFLAGDAEYLSSRFTKKDLVTAITDVVNAKSESDKADAEVDASIDYLEGVLASGRTSEGKPLTEDDKERIRNKIDELSADESGAEPEITETSDAVDEVTAAAEAAAPVGGLNAMKMPQLLKMAAKLNIRGRSSMRKPDLVAAIQARLDAVDPGAETNNDAEVEVASERMTQLEFEMVGLEEDLERARDAGDADAEQQLERQMQELEQEYNELSTVTPDAEPSPSISGAVEEATPSDGIMRREILRVEIESLSARFSELGDRINEGEGLSDEELRRLQAEQSDVYDRIAELYAELDQIDGVEFQARASPTEGVETETEVDSPVEVSETTDAEAKPEVESTGDNLLDQFNALSDTSGNAKLAKDEELGPVARRALAFARRLNAGAEVIAYTDDAGSQRGFSVDGRIYVRVGTRKSEQAAANRGGRRYRRMLERALLDSYVQTIMHENVHIIDPRDGDRSGTGLAAVDVVIGRLTEESQSALLVRLQGGTYDDPEQVRRELRAELLTGIDSTRRSGIRSLYDADASVLERGLDRLRRIIAKVQGPKAMGNMVLSYYQQQTSSVMAEGTPRTTTEGDAADIEMQARGRHEPVNHVRDAAAGYAQSAGIEYDEKRSREGIVSVDVDRARAIADLLENGQHSPNDPAVIEAYDAMETETLAQYEYLKQAGYEMVPWGSPGQPYQSSREMITDVGDNKRIFYYKAVNAHEQGFGSDSALMEMLIQTHPNLRFAGGAVMDSEGRPYRQTVADLFRAVHDIFGHAKEGHQFGPRGEENAWRQHIAMYSPIARRAVTTETRAQNSWVNYGPHLRRADGSLPVPGDEDFIHPADRPYGPQRAMVMPAWVTAENGLDVDDWPDRQVETQFEFQKRAANHVGGRTAKGAIITEDLRDAIPEELRTGGFELPYVTGQTATLREGTAAHDRDLRNVRVSYPVGTFTMGDMTDIRDLAVADLKQISPAGVKDASNMFTSPANMQGFIGNKNDVLPAGRSIISGFPVFDPLVLNSSFVDPTLREDKRFWYEASGDAIRSRTIFSPTNDLRIVSDLLSATSPLTPVRDNFLRAYAIAGDVEYQGFSRVALPTVSLVRRALAGMYQRSNSFKASSFGDTMAFLAGEGDTPPMTTNDVWVAFMFGLRTMGNEGKKTGQHAVFNHPYPYLYISLFNARLTMEVNQRIRSSPEYAAAEQRIADGNATLEDEVLVTPWTPWQLQAYPWSHLSDSGTFDEAMDDAIGLLQEKNHPAAVKLEDGTTAIDLNVAGNSPTFGHTLQPNLEARFDTMASVEVGGNDATRGSERYARKVIDQKLRDPDLTKAERESLLKARNLIYTELNKLLRFLASSNAGGQFFSMSGMSDYVTGVTKSLKTNKTNSLVHELAASMMHGTIQVRDRENIQKFLDERAASRVVGADPDMLDPLETSLAALNQFNTVGPRVNPTSGFETVQEEVEGVVREPAPPPPPGQKAKPVSSGVRTFNLGFGMTKNASGQGGYYDGLTSPNLLLSMYGIPSENRETFLRILGHALGEEMVGAQRWYVGEQQSNSHEPVTVFSRTGDVFSADELGPVEELVDGTGEMFQFVSDTSGGHVIVYGEVDTETADRISKAIGADSVQGGFAEVISVRRGSNNYGVESTLEEFINVDLAPESEWRASLTPAQREAVGRFSEAELRAALSGAESFIDRARNEPRAVRQAASAALRTSRSFRVHVAVREISQRTQRLHEKLNLAVQSAREQVANVDIEFQRRTQNPDSVAFRNWFGKSVVTGRDGKPLIVYHGTAGKEFDEFRSSRVNAALGAGAYFVDDIPEAESYAAGAAFGVNKRQGYKGPTNERVMPMYLRIENPFRYTLGQTGDNTFLKEISRRHEGDPRVDSLRDVFDMMEGDEMVYLSEVLRHLGYDGVIAEFPYKESATSANGLRHYYVTFDPRQVKSAEYTSELGPDAADPRFEYQLRVTFDNKMGMGSVPIQSAGMYSMKKYMTKDEFLDLVPTAGIDSNRSRNIRLKIEDGQAVAPPWLNVEWDSNRKSWKVTGHEGRHRSIAMDEVQPGMRFPVHIFLREADRYEFVEDETGRKRRRKKQVVGEESIAPFLGQKGSTSERLGRPVTASSDVGLDYQGDDVIEQQARRTPGMEYAERNKAASMFVNAATSFGIPRGAIVTESDEDRVARHVVVYDSEGDDRKVIARYSTDYATPNQWAEDLRDLILTNPDQFGGWTNILDMDFEEPYITDDQGDELLVEYMRRGGTEDIQNVMKSLKEEITTDRPAGMAIGHNAKAFGRWFRNQTIVLFADEWHTLTTMVEDIQGVKGSKLATKMDPVQGLRLAPGKVAEANRLFRVRTVNRVQSLMRERGVTNQQLGRFMAANHALERNERIRMINRSRSDIHSDDIEKLNCGISDETANRLLEEHASDPRSADIEEIAASLQEISYETAEIARYAGLITDEDFERITGRYKFYVPMNVTGDEHGRFVTDPVDSAIDRLRRGAGRVGTGSRLDVATGSRTKLKYSLGRKEEQSTVDAIVNGSVSALFNDRMITQTEAINNRIANRLVRLAEKYPTKIINIVTSKEQEKTIGDDKMSVVLVTKSPETDPTLLPVRLEETREVGGVLHQRGDIVYIRINDEQLIEKLGGGRTAESKSRMTQALHMLLGVPRAFTQLLRFTSTQFFSLDFTFTQPLLDGQTALLASLEQSTMSAKDMVRDMSKRMPAVMSTIAKSEFVASVRPELETEGEGRARGPLADYWNEFREIGGKQQWFQISTVDDMVKEMSAVVSADPSSKARRVGRGLKRFTVDMYGVLNDLGDNAWRFSYYVTLRENGVSAEQAGVLARNLTVDFSKKGELGGEMSSLYAFFNAAVQGNIRAYQQLFKGLKSGKGPARVGFGFLTTLGTLSALALQHIGGADEDESGVPDYLEQIPEYERRRNIIIPYGRDENGKIQYSKIRLQYGLEIPYLMGFGAVEVAYGRRNPLEVGADMLTSVVTAFNPLGGTPLDSGHGWLRMVMPDLGDAVTDIVMNRNWQGRQIYYGDDPFQSGGSVRADIGSAKESFGVDWNTTAKLINWVTGGDEAHRGYVDMQPEVWRYLAGTFGGSTLRNVERLTSVSLGLYRSMVLGEDVPDVTDYPVLRRWFGRGPDNPYQTQYYEIRRRVQRADEIADAYADQPDKLKAQRQTIDGRPAMIKRMKSAEKVVRKLRAQIRDLDDKMRALPRDDPGRQSLAEQHTKISNRLAETQRKMIRYYVDRGGDL